MKPFLKYILYRLHLASWLDARLFSFARRLHRKQNETYLKKNPAAVLPRDYDLYETYQLNYQKFLEDGKLAAEEILSWTKKYIPQTEPAILDWGCGVGRIVRHIPSLQPHAIVFGCDINEQMIEWDKQHYTDITFSAINNFAPTLYAPCFFDLVYGMSVFTHIDAEEQTGWITELYRILKKNAILLVTTHGNYYRHQLLPFQKSIVDRQGIFTRTYQKKGHRMMSTYQTASHFKNLVRPYFTVLSYCSGADVPGKIGGQDLWILQKNG